MHNVKKTPASEAINAAYEAKRKAKLQQFLETRELIFQKRSRGELDEEILRITSEVLEKNPDIYTFWNIRRNALISIIQRAEDETDEDYEKRHNELMKNELGLTRKALMANPKSYSAWFQRFWVLEREISPDLKQELELCKTALAVDCRNFHCWDHRRLVVKLAEISAEDELEFSNALIQSNPSNYSAWHYRGMLLMKTQPDVSGHGMVISEDCLAGEFEKILPICSYNAEDQTSWTYCRWLSESACPKEKNEPELLTASFVSPTDVLLVFSSPISKKEVSKLCPGLLDDSKIKAISFAKCLHDKYQKCNNWSLSLDPSQPSISIIVDKDKDFLLEYDSGKSFVNDYAIKKVYSTETRCKSPVAKEALEGLVRVCEELLNIDNDIPWTYAALLRTIILLNGEKDDIITRGDELVQKIKALDPQRENLYHELWERVRFSAKLRDSSSDSSLLDNLLSGDRRLDLRSLSLTSVDHLKHLAGLITDLDLQNNLISDLKQFNVFPGLKSLVLNENPIDKIEESVYLPNLKFLSLGRTNLKEASAVKTIRGSFPRIERLLVCETGLIDQQEEVHAILNPNDSNSKIRIFFYYM
uniref:Geranylgeranyl transferase type-2 subunit alpha n=1 Tax=Acrobeloides nanus TaxID=290746 RepID=A0A914DI45_9BILA